MEEKNKFKIVSRTYGDDFQTVRFIVFNRDTGELTEKVFRANEDDEQLFEKNRHEFEKVEREIAAETAASIKDEIIRMSHGYPQNDSQYIWNHALTQAAECCNG